MGVSFTIAAGLDSAVILRSESRGTHDNILVSQIRESPKLEGQVPVFITPQNRVVPFSSLPTTHRNTVKIFDPASTLERLRSS
jgi:hypothetical protein